MMPFSEIWTGWSGFRVEDCSSLPSEYLFCLGYAKHSELGTGLLVVDMDSLRTAAANAYL